jgi:hypothetical protein
MQVLKKELKIRVVQDILKQQHQGFKLRKEKYKHLFEAITKGIRVGAHVTHMTIQMSHIDVAHMTTWL